MIFKKDKNRRLMKNQTAEVNPLQYKNVSLLWNVISFL